MPSSGDFHYPHNLLLWMFTFAIIYRQQTIRILSFSTFLLFMYILAINVFKFLCKTM